MIVSGERTPGYRIRSYRRRDEPQVLDLLAADILPGQPVPTPAMLGDALAGQSSVDSGWWAELDDLRVDVLTDDMDEAVGVVSFAERRRDNSGVLLWLHAREEQRLIDLLVGHILRCCENRSAVHAFDFATALTLGLEALPVRHRRVTHHVLTRAGFVDCDLWRYMRRALPRDLVGIAAENPTHPVVRVAPVDEELSGWLCTAYVADDSVGEVSIGAPVAGIGVIWWIEVNSQARGAGIGRYLVDFALDLLWENGAREVILYVDDDEPGGERDRAAANRLYDSCGFVEVDRLHSYLRRQE